MRTSKAICAAGLVLTAGCAASFLPGTAIRATLEDHTAILPGGFIEYYAPDGTVHGMSDGQPYQGKWEVRQDAFCTALDGDPPICSRVSRKGDALLWSPDGDSKPSRIDTILPGNPKGL